MLFNSIPFLIYFPVVVLLYFVIPDKMKNYWLLAASLFFYACWNPKYLLLLLLSILLTYITSLLVDRAKTQGKKKVYLTLCLMCNLSILFFFKYYNFAIESICGVFEKVGISIAFPAFDFVLPVGISFYIFQALGYTFDVYRGDVECEKNLFKYALFVSFFPQLVAGPIERSGNLLHQFDEVHRFDAKKAQSGLVLMMLGFFEKLVVAETAAIAANYVFANFRQMTALQLIIGVVIFAVQIYGDFGGYSHIAIGAARVMGFELMDNFRQPYFATSIKDIWRRWHVSLSGWFRDYLYFPLGGGRKGNIRKYFNLCVVFLVSGLWHGASWHYVFWGLVNGVYQMLEDLWDKVTQKRIKAPKWIAILRTFALWNIALIFFRSPSLREAFEYLWYVVVKWQEPFAGLHFSAFGFQEVEMWIFLFGTIALWIVDYRREIGKPLGTWLCRTKAAIRWPICLVICLFIVLVAFRSFGQGAANFIYFQF